MNKKEMEMIKQAVLRDSFNLQLRANREAVARLSEANKKFLREGLLR